MSAAAPHRSERLAHDPSLPARQAATSGSRLLKRLQGPVALGAQGFLLGCLLFFTLQPFATEPVPARSGGGSMLANLHA